MPKINLDKHKEILAEIELIPEIEVTIRNFRAAGIISDLMEKSGCGKPIIVGGLSVEFYTDSRYTTQDIDIIGMTNERFYQLLSELGFTRKTGRHYIHERAKLFIEFPSGELDGSLNRVNSYQTEDGFNIDFIGIEDILVDRIRARVSSYERMQYIWIVEIYQKYKEQLDLVYIRSKLNSHEQQFFFEDLIPALENITNISKYKQLIQLLEYEDSRQLNQHHNEAPLFYYPDKIDEGWIIFNAPKRYGEDLLIDGELETPGGYIAISLDPVFHIVKMNSDNEKLDFYAEDPLEGLTLLEGIEILKNIERWDKNANNFPMLIKLLNEVITD